MNKKVSVIIPMHNSEKYIEECLNSVIYQTYNNLEIIVVDDCSVDLSCELVGKFKDERIKLIRFNENKGVSIARNKGIEIASGDYICFIDSDDVWKKEKIEKQVKFIEENNYEFIYSNYAYFDNFSMDIINKNNFPDSLKIVDVPSKIGYEQAIKNTTIFVSTVMLNMHKLKKEDIYMPNLTIGQDTATWWQILKKGITAYGIKEVLAFYRVSNNSLSSNKLKAVAGAWKIYLREEMSWHKRIHCFCCYLWNAVKRRVF